MKPSGIFLLVIFFLFGFTPLLLAHIGSPDVFYEGNAGPYKLEVFIQPPDVVPGIAKITVKVEGDVVTRVQLQPVYFQYGSEGAPDADFAVRLPKENTFKGQLWLMAFGSASVKIIIEGVKGIGTTIVPVAAVATATRTMENQTTFTLIPLGLLLFAGLVTIIGVSTSQATVPAGLSIRFSRTMKSYIIMAVFGIALVLGLYFAKKWWDAVEGKYKEYMFKPLAVKASFIKDNDTEKILLHLRNQPWLERRLTDLVPDHGKLMHLFLISEDANVFAHIHPVQLDSTKYANSNPGLVKGNYLIFADVVHENGLAETMTDKISATRNIPLQPGLSEDDASYAVYDSLSKDNSVHISSKNSDTLRSNVFTKLNFILTDLKGEICLPEPYLGMAGHAVVMKADHSVFIHLHPMGTVSMASQAALAGRVTGNVTLCNNLSDSLESVLNKSGVADAKRVSVMKTAEISRNVLDSPLNFPYAFPSPGKYYVWVQVKKNHKIFTERFTYYVL